MKRGYLISFLALAVFGIAIISYTQRSSPEKISETPQTHDDIVLSMPNTAEWQIYRNTDFGFMFKYPKQWKLQRTFPGRVSSGRPDRDPRTNPQIYDISAPGTDSLKELPEVSVYFLPAVFSACPSNDGAGYINADAEKIMVDGMPATTRSGRVIGADTPAGSYAREVYVCTEKGYFRFSTPLLSSATFAGVLSTFRFGK